MPLIVDLSGGTPATATSDDGILTGTVDPDFAGVRFIVKYGQVNYAVNGDFEDDVAGWTPAGTATPAVEWQHGGGLSGSGALKATWAGDVGQVDGVLAGLTVGQQYKVTAWILALGVATPVRLELDIGPTSDEAGLTNSWVRLILEFTATSTSHTVSLVLQAVPDDPGTITILDEVECRPTALTEPHHVRIWRRNPDDTVWVVRGSDPTPAPDGQAPGYDIEAPLGQVCDWWATVHDRSDAILVTSGEIMLPVPAPTTSVDTWLKSIAEPGVSALVRVESWPSFAFRARSSSQDVIGNPYPVAVLDVRSAGTSQIVLLSYTDEERLALERLFHLGRYASTDPVGQLLVQTIPVNGQDDLYYIPGDVTVDRVGRLGANPVRRWTVPLTQIARPPTAGSALRDPERSFATMPYDTWIDVGFAYDRFLAIGS